jgi:hypothetical protein
VPLMCGFQGCDCAGQRKIVTTPMIARAAIDSKRR